MDKAISYITDLEIIVQGFVQEPSSFPLHHIELNRAIPTCPTLYLINETVDLLQRFRTDYQTTQCHKPHPTLSYHCKDRLHLEHWAPIKFIFRHHSRLKRLDGLVE